MTAASIDVLGACCEPRHLGGVRTYVGTRAHDGRGVCVLDCEPRGWLVTLSRDGVLVARGDGATLLEAADACADDDRAVCTAAGAL